MKKAWDLCNQDWPGCSIMNLMHLKVIVFGGVLIVLQCFVHVQSNFQPLPTKLVFGCFDRGSCIYFYLFIYIYTYVPNIYSKWYPCQLCDSMLPNPPVSRTLRKIEETRGA